MIVPGQQNIKVHFAACENVNQFNALNGLGSRYSLYTVFPFIERIVFKKFKSPLIPCQFKGIENQIPNFIIKNSAHTIQDSGLFTLMFGSQKGKKDKKFIDRWYDELIKFTLLYNTGAAVVEVDCQKVLGVNQAWKYRERMKKDLPNHRQINVFHLEDKQKGLDRMIEFSDYIAISVPELRLSGKKGYTQNLASYIKNRKPEIDIHLLGCTDMRILRDLKFCTSCDSSSYTSGVRYGWVAGNKVSKVKVSQVRELVSDDTWILMNKYISESRAAILIVNIFSEMQKYKQLGSQL